MQAKETGDDWDHRYPKEHKIVEPQRSAIRVEKSDKEIVVVRPKDSDHDKAQCVYRQQADELLEGPSIIREGKDIWNANFQHYDGDGDREDTIRKTFDASVARLKLGFRRPHGTGTRRAFPFSTT